MTGDDLTALAQWLDDVRTSLETLVGLGVVFGLALTVLGILVFRRLGRVARALEAQRPVPVQVRTTAVQPTDPARPWLDANGL